MACYSPLQGYRSPVNGGLIFKGQSTRYGSVDKMEVACGQCLGCRLDKSRMWAARIVHESTLHPENCFVTLTYDDEHMPRLFSGGPGTLRKKDFQDFMKRLRWRFPGRKIRYYHCGEYGEQLDRPHYHACLFNLSFGFDQTLFHVRKEHQLFVSKTLDDLWPHGFASVGELTFESAAYVARYCVKKVTGEKAHNHYLRADEYGVAYWLEPEYSTMSRRPGIGRDWYEKYKADVFPADKAPVPFSKNQFVKVPRYYDELHKVGNPGEHEAVKERRAAFKESNPGEFAPDRLRQKYEVKRAQLSRCKRVL